MDLNRLAQQRVAQITHSVSIDIDGETLNAVLRPGGLSPATQVRLANAPDPSNLTDPSQLAELVRIMTRVLCEIVVEWDVELDGQLVPLTEDALSDLPGDALYLLFGEIMGQVGDAPKETSKPSKPSTPRAAKRTRNS